MPDRKCQGPFLFYFQIFNLPKKSFFSDGCCRNFCLLNGNYVGESLASFVEVGLEAVRRGRRREVRAEREEVPAELQLSTCSIMNGEINNVAAI
jgi:hypothetical protein